MVPRNSLCVHKQSKAPWEQRGGGGGVVPNTLLDAHAFSTSIREFLQIPKTTGKKRKETDSSSTDETPGKIMRTGTTEQWKKVVPKNGRRKASPKHKAGTIPFNPNPIGPIPINSDNLNRSTDPKVPGTQGATAPKGQNLLNLSNTSIKPPSAQKTTSETTSNSAKPLKTQGATGSEGPKSPNDINPKTSTVPPKTTFHDDMEGAKSSGSSKHQKAPKGFEYLFFTISLLEKLSFPVHLRDTKHGITRIEPYATNFGILLIKLK